MLLVFIDWLFATCNATGRLAVSDIFYNLILVSQDTTKEDISH